MNGEAGGGEAVRAGRTSPFRSPSLLPLPAWQGVCAASCPGTDSAPSGPSIQTSSLLPAPASAPSGPTSKESSVFFRRSWHPVPRQLLPTSSGVPHPRTRRLSRATGLVWTARPPRAPAPLQPTGEETEARGWPSPAARPEQGRRGEGAQDHLPCSAVIVNHSINKQSQGRGEVGAGVQSGPQSRGISRTPRRPWRTWALAGSSSRSHLRSAQALQGAALGFGSGWSPGTHTREERDPCSVAVGITEGWGRGPKGLGSWRVRVSEGGLRAGVWLVECGSGRGRAGRGGGAGSVAWRGTVAAGTAGGAAPR